MEETLAHGGVLVVESGTGTGKTFAYLAPLLLSGRRAIISTGTRHLQEQIFKCDLPQVGGVLNLPVDAALLKGRANYLCRYRLKLQAHQAELLDEDETESIRRIEQWAAATRDGDIAEVPSLGEESPLWKLVTSTADNCLGRQCPDFNGCFVVKARQRAMQADIVVVNHHLFFSDLTLKTEGFGELLPQHDAVVFDEAHSIAAVASDFFGISLSDRQIGELGRDALAAESDEQSGVKFAPEVARLEKALKHLRRASQPFAGQSIDFDSLQNARFDEACEGLRQALERCQQALALAAPAGEGLGRCHARCLSIQERFETWLQGRDSNLVRWAEVGPRRFRLHGTPLQISRRFAELVEDSRAAWIFTSATLAVGDDFSAFCSRLGLHDAHTRRWASPYDFSKNALLYLPKCLPDPREPSYAEALSEVIAGVLGASRGRAFCLFTSYEMMQRVHQQLHAADCAWLILLQGQAPRGELLSRFRREDHSVLFGTSSFWEGVDVVGERLSCVIIDKLPFAPPTEPVLKHRLRVWEEEGGNPFMDIQIPEAVIALKQGAGRLIRSESDRGVLVLCDPRLVSRGYGRLFLASLPGMAVTREMDEVAGFFTAADSHSDDLA